MVTQQQVETWVDGYVRAWGTNASKDIAALFTPKAEYHEWPYATDWVGRTQIVEGWQSRAAWQEGGWEFEWSTLMITGDTIGVTAWPPGPWRSRRSAPSARSARRAR